MAYREAYVQVAVDGAGKLIRNVSVDQAQEDGSVLLVHQQVVTRAAEDGTILDTVEWVETEREKYMRHMLENAIAMAPLQGGMIYRTTTIGE